MEFYDFPFSWECHHPNWRTHIFERGRWLNHHQPEKWWAYWISCEYVSMIFWYILWQHAPSWDGKHHTWIRFATRRKATTIFQQPEWTLDPLAASVPVGLYNFLDASVIWDITWLSGFQNSNYPPVVSVIKRGNGKSPQFIDYVPMKISNSIHYQISGDSESVN